MTPDRVTAMVNAMIEACPFTQLSVPPTLYVEWRAWEDMARAALDLIDAEQHESLMHLSSEIEEGLRRELGTLRLRLDVTTQDQQFARAQQEQEARELARLRTELGDARGWYENVKEELRISTERIARLEDWIRDQHEADHEPACVAEGCDVCLFLSRLAPDAGPAT